MPPALPGHQYQTECFRHCRYPRSGYFPWGEHLGCDLVEGRAVLGGGEDAAPWERARRVLAAGAAASLPAVEAALRWVLSDARVHTAIVGTTGAAHLDDNLDAAEVGPLEARTHMDLGEAYAAASPQAEAVRRWS